MVKRKSDLEPEHRDLLNWAFNLNARVPLNWQIVAQPLWRSAAFLYDRSRKARQLHAELFYQDEAGLPTARPSPLTPQEDDLLPDVGMCRVAFMLLGMAIECLSKGTLIGRNPSWAFAGELNERLTTHDLERLVADCGVLVEGEDLVALRLLTEHVVWAGRYHIPKDAERIARLTTKQKLQAQTPEYQDFVFSFGNQLFEQLYQLCDDGHLAEKSAERMALAQAESASIESPPPGETRPSNFFNLARPRVCPFCSKPAVFRIVEAAALPSGASGVTVRLGATEHQPPVCEEWLRAEHTDAFGLAVHVLTGRPKLPPVIIRRVTKEPAPDIP